MTALPTRANFGQAAVTEANNQAAMGAVYDYLAALFGSDGTAKTALATVGALGANAVKKSAAYTVVAGDRGMLIICEGTSWTLDLLAIATAGKGFPLIVWSRASGTITIDGNGAEKIKSAYATDQTNGDTTLALANGEACFLVAMDEGAGVVYWTAPLVGKRLASGFQPLTASVASNALTVTLGAGAVLPFSDGTTTTLAAPISVTVSNGSTLGTSNGVAARLWAFAVKNGGTPELAIINTWDGSNIYGLMPTDIISTTAEGGAGAADSAQVPYSTTARANQAIAVAGYLEITEATAGVWATAPSLVQGYGPGVPLPGQAVGSPRVHSRSDLANTTTVIPGDDTIPQNTEGAEFFSVAFTPRSALNIADLALTAWGACAATSRLVAAFFQDSTANAFAASTALEAGSTGTVQPSLRARVVIGTAAATTLRARLGPMGSTTFYLNGNSVGSRFFGGAGASLFQVQEIQR